VKEEKAILNSAGHTAMYMCSFEDGVGGVRWFFLGDTMCLLQTRTFGGKVVRSVVNQCHRRKPLQARSTDDNPSTALIVLVVVVVKIVLDVQVALGQWSANHFPI
jgi:hypothetical protein